MKKKEKAAIKEYQCSGCVSGPDLECYEHKTKYGIQCDKHHPGTMISGIGMVFLGMPRPFCRTGNYKLINGNSYIKIYIYNRFQDLDETWFYDKYNIPVWKYKNDKNHVFVRGLCPRINRPFLHVILEDCLDKINCLEITDQDIKEMD